MAGNLSIERCGQVFQGSRQASSNYGVGTDGRIAMYVEEKDRALTSSNTANDNRAVTIEVANCGGEPDWKVSDKALEATIALCVDICQRNSIERLNFTGDKNGNLTMHSYFAATACPGPYLKSKFAYIAEEVNRRLAGKAPEKKGDYTMEMRILKEGNTGEDVRALQILLNGRGKAYNCGNTDGIFGSKTKTAVIAYQKAKGLEKDGIAGPVTMSSLMGV
jgi:N-acetyl-anhydromuramyl-L-alanine amidase AmpD